MSTTNRLDRPAHHRVSIIVRLEQYLRHGNGSDQKSQTCPHLPQCGRLCASMILNSCLLEIDPIPPITWMASHILTPDAYPPSAPLAICPRHMNRQNNRLQCHV